MTNEQIANVFRRLASLLELRGEIFFKVRSYQSAADTIEDWPQPLAELFAEQSSVALRIGHFLQRYQLPIDGNTCRADFSSGFYEQNS